MQKIILKLIHLIFQTILFCFVFTSCISVNPYILVTNKTNLTKDQGGISGSTSVTTYQNPGTFNSAHPTAFTTYTENTATTVNGKKPIFISKSDFSSLGVTDIKHFLELCNRKKYKDALAELETLKISEDKRNLLVATIYCLQLKNHESLEVLKELNIKEYESYIELLKLDNIYEIKKTSDYNKNSKKELLDLYQKLFDSGIIKGTYITILKNRIKHLRYE
ncbi:MAG: hypothetical protein ACPGSD_09545 [Flavobacteriales bacterium]